MNPSRTNMTFRAHSSARIEDFLVLDLSAKCRGRSMYKYTINDDLTCQDREPS
jgi:hypothetical protein